MDLIVRNQQLAIWSGLSCRCAVGRNGFVDAALKREGDGKTPIGAWPLRRVFYRSDRLSKPVTILPVHALMPDDAWCDMAEDPQYNRRIKLPGPTRDERLWREDHAYDLLVILGYNDAPPVPGRGSAIFLHVLQDEHRPTAGCVALGKEDLLHMLQKATLDSMVRIEPDESIC